MAPVSKGKYPNKPKSKKDIEDHHFFFKKEKKSCI